MEAVQGASADATRVIANRVSGLRLRTYWERDEDGETVSFVFEKDFVLYPLTETLTFETNGNVGRNRASRLLRPWTQGPGRKHGCSRDMGHKRDDGYDGGDRGSRRRERSPRRGGRRP